MRSTKTIGTESGLLSGTLVTRDIAPTIIIPNSSDQVLNSGIYDNPITIKAGARLASGTSTSSSTTMTPIFGFQDPYYYITVTGLGFRPNRVIMKAVYSEDRSIVCTYDFGTRNGVPSATAGANNYNFIVVSAELSAMPNQGYVRVYEFSVSNLPASGFAMATNSFRLPVPVANTNVIWEAISI